MPTPTWSAARNGLPGDANAVDKSAQVNQFLGTHGVTAVYAGTQLITPNGNTPLAGVQPNYSLLNTDYDQPFVLPSGTTVGRVSIPVSPVGVGADLQVSLYTDVAGAPGALLTTTRIPATWINAFGSADGSLSGPLALAQYNTVQTGIGTTILWASPAASGSGVAGNPMATVNGNTLISAGGTIPGNISSGVFTIEFTGSALSNAALQPSLPETAYLGTLVATPDTLVCIAGQTGSPAVNTANVYAAQWDPSTVTVSTWSVQPALPVALYLVSAASWNENIYVVGGTDGVTTSFNTVYYTSIQNGQLQAWSTGPPLPVGVNSTYVVAMNGFLIVVGGGLTVGTDRAMFYAKINTDGSLGQWQTGPPAPYTTFSFGGVGCSTTTNALVILGNDSTTDTRELQSLTFGVNGPGSWVTQYYTHAGHTGAFAAGVGGQWTLINAFATLYYISTLYPVPQISVPLPTTGLTGGNTYHLVLHQPDGDLNDYLTTWVTTGNALPLAYGTNVGGGGWSYLAGSSIAINVFNLSTGGQVWHTWEDSGARITTFAYATTPDQRLLGIADSSTFIDGTRTSSVRTVDYAGTWPSAGVWPPTGVGKTPA